MFQKCDIESHMRAEHGRYSNQMFGEKRPFQCHNCKCALSKDPSQDMHICKPYFVQRRSRVKQNKEPIKCDMCDREFDRQATLFTHMATAHSEERNFPCTYCDFKVSVTLYIIMTHVSR